MADPESAPWLTAPAVQSVAASTGTSTFGVHGDAWASVSPGLPAELAAMLAPPISVSTAPLDPPPRVDERRRAELARYRLNMASPPPYGRHRRSARTT